MKQYDVAVFIGRFQPLHKSHIEIMEKAKELADKVLVLVGSANKPRTVRNPWTYLERSFMIRFSVSGVETKPLEDRTYNHQQWLINVQQLVTDFAGKSAKVCLIGHNKDSSSFYLTNFPQWDFVEVGNINDINSTDIRSSFFNNGIIDSRLPSAIIDALEAFKESSHYPPLVKEWEYFQDYKRSWAQSPFPPIFVTVDAVVIQSGHILLITRKVEPGKGLYALPGGFIDQNETLMESCIRELKEETGLKVPVPVLEGSLSKKEVFDNPERSLRGRTITHAFLFELKDDKELPRIKGGDDAEKAMWVPLADFYQMQEQIFEDHWSIVRRLVDNE